MRETVPRLLIALAIAIAGAACASQPEQASSVEASTGQGIIAAAEGRTWIDVRTPAEYAEGHLEDALNIDLQSASFRERIAELPHDGSYLVYCRSGNRSAQAARIMAELGFTDVVDGGGFADLVEAGLPRG